MFACVSLTELASEIMHSDQNVVYSKAASCISSSSKYPSSSLGIHPGMKLPNSSNGDKKQSKSNDVGYSKGGDRSRDSSPKVSSQLQHPPVSSIFTSPLSLASNLDKGGVSTTTSLSSSIASSLPSSILR